MLRRLPHYMKSYLLIIVHVLGIISWHLLFAPPLLAAPLGDANLVPQTVLIQFKESATESERAAFIATINGQLVHWLPQIHVAEVQLLNSADASDDFQKESAAEVAQSRWQAAGRNLQFIESVENDVVVEGTYLPNDPDIANQVRTYSLQTTHTLEAWDYTRGSSAVIIAVLDSGINPNHPEFRDRLLPGYDMVNDDNEPNDDHGHGTHTAGIVAAGIDNGMGMAGVCPNCSILPVKVLNQNNAGTWSGVAQGILYATDHGARVISLSLGASVSSNTLETAVNYAVAHNVLVVAAAGNMGVERKFYPAALDNVMAVSATDANDQRWVLSNMGDYIDVAAPGHAVYSTYNDLANYYSGYTYMSGTSMAAPHVAGLAGLLLSQKPERSAADLYQVITTTADKLDNVNYDSYMGYGRINALRAVMLEVSQPVTVTVSEQTPVSTEAQTQSVFIPLVTKN